jgi:diguanylate cyclase
MHPVSPAAAAQGSSATGGRSANRAAAPALPADASAELLRRALPLMARHGAGYAPDSYAIWYEYVRGGNRALREHVDTLIRGSERLSASMTQALHQKHLVDRTERSVRQASAGLLEMMHTMRSSLELARSGATEFDARLAAFGDGIAAGGSTADISRHVVTMRDDVGRMNRSLSTLTAQLEASHEEVAKLRGELRRVREEASRDPLSGVLNRRSFDTELARLCREADASGTTMSLVMLDIDHFKRINDTYGHPFGDQVIRAVGQVLSSLTRERDVAARYGGEEFALLLPQTQVTGAREVAERIRVAIARGHIKRGDGDAPVGTVTVSAGVAQRMPGEEPTPLLARADRALYASKQAGRDRVTIDG